jgi:autotransporter-associated beta strand protein
MKSASIVLSGVARRGYRPAKSLSLAVVLLAVAYCPARAAVIVSCGFELTGDTWTHSPDGPINTNPGAADYPANQRILAGEGSWLTAGTTSTLIFDEVLLSGWRDVAVCYRVSATAATPNGGVKPLDSVAAYVATGNYSNSTVPEFGGTADITLRGYGGGATWGYQTSAPRIVHNAGWNGVVQPAGDGPRDADGYNDFAILVPNGKRSLRLKLSSISSTAGRFWNIDNVSVEGTPTTSAQRWWDGDGAGTVGGGTGTWGNSLARWAAAPNGNTYSVWDGARGDNAVFSGQGGTVTIDKAYTAAARSLAFAADGYTLAANGASSFLALVNGGSGGPGAAAIEVSEAAHTVAINAPIIGNPGVGLAKFGDGTLVLGGVNKYTGQTAIHAGTIAVAIGNNLGKSGTPVLFDGGTLRINAPLELAASHPFIISTSGTVDVGGNNCAMSADGWSGTGTLTKLGAGTLALSGENAGFRGNLLVRQGTLRLESAAALAGCQTIDLAAGAVLDISAAEGFQLGAAARQSLEGAGDVRGNLTIGSLGVHALGHSPSVQRVQGDYQMNGRLEIEICGPMPGDGTTGHDQVLVVGDSHDIILGGELELLFSGVGWSSADNKLWIIRNDTAGILSGEFAGLPNAAAIGQYDGRLWRIHYGADSGALGGGNDVLLAADVPEPGCLVLLLVAIICIRIFLSPGVYAWEKDNETTKCQARFTGLLFSAAIKETRKTGPTMQSLHCFSLRRKCLGLRNFRSMVYDRLATCPTHRRRNSPSSQAR